jgi:uncharacterized protein
MTVHRVALAEVPPQPWKNGGGVTHELLAWPAGGGHANPGAWQLRVSVATIAADGPFSPFPGVRRWFAVLEGAGVRLQHAAGEQLCRPGDAPWSFDGADAPGCTLLGGPTRDLNLMLRGRGHMHRAVQELTPAGPAADPTSTGTPVPWRGVYDPIAATLSWTDTPGATLPAPGHPVYWLTLESLP